MIARLEGKVIDLEEDGVILDVSGVGYKVMVGAQVLSSAIINSTIVLHIEMQVRQDSITLYGFHSLEQRKCFSLLQLVQGVGAKMALAILNHLTIPQIMSAIVSKDSNAFRAVSGVGPKIAERIVTELKGRKDLLLLPEGQTANTSSSVSNDNFAEAMQALIALGFSRSDSYNALMSANDSWTDQTQTQDLITLALSRLSKI